MINQPNVAIGQQIIERSQVRALVREIDRLQERVAALEKRVASLEQPDIQTEPTPKLEPTIENFKKVFGSRVGIEIE